MSVRCPLHAPREHAQTQRVPSHVSSVSLVSESLRMDNSAMVRLCLCRNVMFIYLNTGVCSFCSNMPDLALIPNKVAVECASSVEHVCQLLRAVYKQHQV